MQGRLLPKFNGRYQAHPVGYWQKEFDSAAAFGLDCIEFIFDYNDAEANPLLSESGADEILAVSDRTGVAVKTVCADYFMEAPLHHADDSVGAGSQRILERLLARGVQLGLTDIVIPCVDQSGLRDAAETERLVRRITAVLERAEAAGINLSLETDLAPQSFAELLDRFDSPRVTANYDTGNSAALGYDPAEELASYGDRITDIHIKDRVRGGGSVPLGTGDADFPRFIEALRPLDYRGPIIMQVFRDDDGVAAFSEQLHWFRSKLSEWDFESRHNEAKA